jgi:hypothetical protein
MGARDPHNAYADDIWNVARETPGDGGLALTAQCRSELLSASTIHWQDD